VSNLPAPEYPLAMAVRAGPALFFSWPSGYRRVGDVSRSSAGAALALWMAVQTREKRGMQGFWLQQRQGLTQKFWLQQLCAQ